ncbi:hypothetical protein FA10DRAFT_267718 [Acaromyces ingoldii]|uniref:Uncharacterized protein n=1 Tax=Acaromyces ingoldii TaxID=215250 RepID=A0A316YI61_9BASI|nr:hypothetical protein FA10DRAFT_267718 [Acaromyces ingoldii]PWN89117.1 hypothetical protein FA10DRAFT_267718 [Acaromyces ingoldii]
MSAALCSHASAWGEIRATHVPKLLACEHRYREALKKYGRFRVCQLVTGPVRSKTRTTSSWRSIRTSYSAVCTQGHAFRKGQGRTYREGQADEAYLDQP